MEAFIMMIMIYNCTNKATKSLMNARTVPHRAQVVTTFQNEIPQKARQGTVFHYRINTYFVCSKRLRK